MPVGEYTDKQGRSYKVYASPSDDYGDYHDGLAKAGKLDETYPTLKRGFWTAIYRTNFGYSKLTPHGERRYRDGHLLPVDPENYLKLKKPLVPVKVGKERALRPRVVISSRFQGEPSDQRFLQELLKKIRSEPPPAELPPPKDAWDYLHSYHEDLWRYDPALVDFGQIGRDERGKIQRLAVVLYKVMTAEKQDKIDFKGEVMETVGAMDFKSDRFRTLFSRARKYLIVALQHSGATEEDTRRAKCLELRDLGL